MNTTNRIAIGLVVLGLIGALCAAFKSKPPAELSTPATSQEMAKVEKKKKHNNPNPGTAVSAVAQLEANPSFSDKVPAKPTPEQVAKLNIQQ